MARSAALALVALSLLLAACTAGATASPDLSDSSVASPSPSFSAEASFNVTAATASPSEAPSADPSTAAEPTVSPPAAATPGPTPRPTLADGQGGYALGVRSPVAIGGAAQIKIVAQAGETCSVGVRYPSGGSAGGLDPHTFRTNGTWTWNWTIPSSAGLGTAIVKTDCVLLGTSFPGAGKFSIVTVVPTPTPRPTPTPLWGITGSVVDPVHVPGLVVFSGHVTGDPPPGIAPIDLRCELRVSDTLHGQLGFVQDGSVQTRDFGLSLAIVIPVSGTATWKVSCFPTAPGSRSVSGTLQLVMP